ncbi:MAG: metallophosphoesterase [Ignavibacteria bacterium]|nr:metallophosphoesterase [Ignavibacteria bacterium]
MSKTKSMVTFFLIFFFVFGSINFYIFLRGWQSLAYLPSIKPYYLVLFLFIFLSYLIAKFFVSSLPPFLYDILMWIGSFWFVYMFYFVLVILFVDILRLVDSFTDFFPEFIHNNYNTAKLITAITMVVLVSIPIFIGHLNTKNVKVRELILSISKRESSLTELNIVFLADLHLSIINDESFLDKVVDKVNELKPDIILFGGDIVDDKAWILDRKNIGPSLRKLKSKFGIYTCTGNHEYINGVQSSVNWIKRFGIDVIQDDVIEVAQNIYLIGREDRSINQFTGEKRKSLKEILSRTQKQLPLILLDHQPLNLEEAQQNGIDLQLSGHTHHGQIFPANFITKLVYELSWGYLKKGNTHYYVTSGVGTWGPPVRSGSPTEIVLLRIKLDY